MSVASVPLAVEILLVVIFGVNLTDTLPRYASGLQLSCPRADFNWSCAGGFMLIANRLLFSFLGPCSCLWLLSLDVTELLTELPGPWRWKGAFTYPRPSSPVPHPHWHHAAAGDWWSRLRAQWRSSILWLYWFLYLLPTKLRGVILVSLCPYVRPSVRLGSNTQSRYHV